MIRNKAIGLFVLGNLLLAAACGGTVEGQNKSGLELCAEGKLIEATVGNVVQDDGSFDPSITVWAIHNDSVNGVGVYEESFFVWKTVYQTFIPTRIASLNETNGEVVKGYWYSLATNLDATETYSNHAFVKQKDGNYLTLYSDISTRQFYIEDSLICFDGEDFFEKPMIGR